MKAEPKIQEVGRLIREDIPDEIHAHASLIKLENYKTNTPRTFQKHVQANAAFLRKLSEVTGVPENLLDWVYFSVCEGAAPHVDDLGPRFTDETYVVPIILPTGASVITAEEESAIVELFSVYKFNHNKIHAMTLADTKSGCVVVMVARKVSPELPRSNEQGEMK